MSGIQSIEWKLEQFLIEFRRQNQGRHDYDELLARMIVKEFLTPTPTPHPQVHMTPDWQTEL